MCAVESLAFPSNGKRTVIIDVQYGVSLPIHVAEEHVNAVVLLVVAK